MVTFTRASARSLISSPQFVICQAASKRTVRTGLPYCQVNGSRRVLRKLPAGAHGAGLGASRQQPGAINTSYRSSLGRAAPTHGRDRTQKPASATTPRAAISSVNPSPVRGSSSA